MSLKVNIICKGIYINQEVQMNYLTKTDSMNDNYAGPGSLRWN